MSKFEGLVRVVTRNYQRFSDASSNVSTNMKGRLYEFFGADWSIIKNQTGQERYQEVYGDVAAGEVLRGFPSPSIIIPAQDTRVRKQWLKDALGNSVMIETLFQDGQVTLVIESWNTNPTPAVVNSNTTTNTNGSYNTTVTDQTNTSYITITPTEILIDNNGKAKGTFGVNSVVLAYDNKSHVTLTGTSSQIDFNGTSIGIFDASKASITSGGHFCTVSSTGVALG
jgi:hypothetical protein